MKKQAVLAAVVLLAVAPAWAQRAINEVRPLNADGSVTISNLAGSVKVIGWSNAQVEITGTLGKNVEDLEIEGDASELTIDVDVPRHADDLDTDLVVKVPATADIDIETVSATIEVEGVTGSLDLETVSGWVRTSGRPREMSIETVSGDITLAEAARADLSSVSGAIVVQLAVGRLDAETVSGAIRVDNGSLEAGSFETVSGKISYAGDIVGQGEFDFESMSGSISLELPSSVSAEFDVTTFSGSIDNDIGPHARRTSQYTSEQELRFSAGSGGSKVSISAFSGSVKIKTR
jgi:DUF4097 and DUF4098 domain-containing protein YvlB